MGLRLQQCSAARSSVYRDDSENERTDQHVTECVPGRRAGSCSKTKIDSRSEKDARQGTIARQPCLSNFEHRLASRLFQSKITPSRDRFHPMPLSEENA